MKQTKQKLFMIALVLLMGVSTTATAEILLGKYDFSTKSTVPVEQAEGVTFGSTFGVWNTTDMGFEMSISDDGYLLVRSEGTGVSPTRYGYVSITPEDGKTVRITKLVVKHFKVEGSNTNRSRSYLYDMGGPTPIDKPTIVSNLIYQGNGGFLIPDVLTEDEFAPSAPVEINSIHYMSFTGTQNSRDANDLSQYKIESMAFYGEILSPGDIVATQSVDFGTVLPGNVVDASVSLKVMGGTSDPVAIELIDPDFAFSCLQSQVEPIDATAGTSIRVSYNPFSPGKHTAQLKFSYGDKVAYTALSGISPFLNETFTYFVSDPLMQAEMDSTNINDYAQEEYLTMPGWEFSDSVYWHLSGSYGLGIELRGNNSTIATASTPAMDMSAPFGMTFRSKKKDNRETIVGDMYILVDNDTIFSFVNPNNAMNVLRSVDGFIAGPESKITFAGVANDSSKIVVDEISIFPTSTPTLDLPAYSSKAFTSADEPVTIDIPVTAYQLESDLEVVLSGTPAGYEVLTPTIAKDVAETGTNIQVQYTKPAEGAEVSAVVEVKGGGLTDYRYISLINSAATGLRVNTINAIIFAKERAIAVSVEEPAVLEVFSFDGSMILKQQVSGQQDVTVQAGVYMVRLSNTGGCNVQKVIVR